MKSKPQSQNWLIYVAATIFLITTMIVTLWPRYRPEAFDGSDPRKSSYSLYTSSGCTTESDVIMRQVGSAVDRNQELFQMKGCYKFGGDIDSLMIQNQLFSNSIEETYIESFNKSTSNFLEIVQEVKRRVEVFANAQSSQAIYGDVYVFVTQVPFYRDEKGGVVTNTTNQPDKLDPQNPFASLPYPPYRVRSADGAVSNVGPVLYYAWIVYDRYNTSKNYMGSANRNTFTYKYLPQLNKYQSKDPQCFMTGAGTTNMFAGCATKMNMSKCEDTAVMNPFTYVVMYSLNLGTINIKMARDQYALPNCSVYQSHPELTSVPLECTMSYWKSKGCHNQNFIKPCEDPWKSGTYAQIKERIDNIASGIDDKSKSACHGNLSDGAYKDMVIKDDSLNYYYVDTENILHPIFNVVHPSPVSDSATLVPSSFYSNANKGRVLNSSDVLRISPQLSRLY